MAVAEVDPAQFTEACTRCRIVYNLKLGDPTWEMTTGRDLDKMPQRVRNVARQLLDQEELDALHSYVETAVRDLPLCPRCGGRKIIARDKLLEEARARIEDLERQLKSQEKECDELYGEVEVLGHLPGEVTSLREGVEVRDELIRWLQDVERGLLEMPEVWRRLRELDWRTDTFTLSLNPLHHGGMQWQPQL